MTIYKIPVELEVVADNENDADAYVCVILDMAFKYGLGLCECARQNMESPKDVTRLFDYSFIEEEEESVAPRLCPKCGKPMVWEEFDTETSWECGLVCPSCDNGKEEEE